MILQVGPFIFSERHVPILPFRDLWLFDRLALAKSFWNSAAMRRFATWIFRILLIPCAVFRIVKWPLLKVKLSDFQLRGWKGHFENFESRLFFFFGGVLFENTKYDGCLCGVSSMPFKVSFSLGGLHSHYKCHCTMSFVLKLLNTWSLRLLQKEMLQESLLGSTSLNSCMSMSKTNIQFHLAKVCLRKFS